MNQNKNAPPPDSEDRRLVRVTHLPTAAAVLASGIKLDSIEPDAGDPSRFCFVFRGGIHCEKIAGAFAVGSLQGSIPDFWNCFEKLRDHCRRAQEARRWHR